MLCVLFNFSNIRKVNNSQSNISIILHIQLLGLSPGHRQPVTHPSFIVDMFFRYVVAGNNIF